MIAKGLLLFEKEQLFVAGDAFAFAKGVLLNEKQQMTVAKEELPFERQEMAFARPTTVIEAGTSAIAAAIFFIAMHPLLIALQHMAIAKQTTAIEACSSAIAAATISFAKQYAAIARQTMAFELDENELFRGDFAFFALRAGIACSFVLTQKNQKVKTGNITPISRRRP